MPSPDWITKTENLSKGIFCINSIEHPKFDVFLNRTVKMSESQDQNFTEDEIEKLGIMFKLPKESILHSIKTVRFIVKKMNRYIFKPAVLQQDLLNLGLNEVKSQLFLNIWLESTKNLFTDMQLGENTSIQDELKTELCSSVAKQSAKPKAGVVLKDVRNNVINLEMAHDELSGLYMVLECVQSEIDAIVI